MNIRVSAYRNHRLWLDSQSVYPLSGMPRNQQPYCLLLFCHGQSCTRRKLQALHIDLVFRKKSRLSRKIPVSTLSEWLTHSNLGDSQMPYIKKKKLNSNKAKLRGQNTFYSCQGLKVGSRGAGKNVQDAGTTLSLSLLWSWLHHYFHLSKP